MDSIHHGGSRGALIVLEGLDRSGKTSQCSRLVSHLEGKGISVEAWRFPDRKTDIGTMISSYLANKSQLDDQAVHLLFSANRWEKRLFCISLQLICVHMDLLYVTVLHLISLCSHYIYNAVMHFANIMIILGYRQFFMLVKYMVLVAFIFHFMKFS